MMNATLALVRAVEQAFAAEMHRNLLTTPPGETPTAEEAAESRRQIDERIARYKAMTLEERVADERAQQNRKRDGQ
jgi:hypothetical protein